MKTIYSLLILGLVVASCSFKDDTYNGTENLEEITISGIEKTYTLTAGFDDFDIEPDVKASDKNAEFEYQWTMENKSLGKSLVISTDKNLKERVSQIPGEWQLIYSVKNKRTQYTKYFASTVGVISNFSIGWHVLKDDGTDSDIDFFPCSTSVEPHGKAEDVFSSINGRKLAGRAGNLCYTNSYPTYIIDPDKKTNVNAIYVCSENDASILYASTLQELNDFNGLFYIVPDVKSVNSITAGSGTAPEINVINNKMLHKGGGGSDRFRILNPKDVDDTPYSLSKYYICGGQYSYFFDELSSSFIGTTSTKYLPTVADNANTKKSGKNMNQDLLFMGIRNASYGALAVFRDRTDPSIKSLALISPSLSSFNITSYTQIEPTSKLYSATTYTCNFIDESILYFVSDNKVWSYNLLDNKEQLQYTPPAGEIVVLLRHKKMYHASLAPFLHSLIAVGTVGDSKYNIRMFEKQAGNLYTEPQFTLSGSGENIGDLFFIKPGLYPVISGYNLSVF